MKITRGSALFGWGELKMGGVYGLNKWWVGAELGATCSDMILESAT